jgi:hypothetical protein
MKRLRLVLAATLLLTTSSLVLAQGGYDLSWWTVDGGGTTDSSGAGYSLDGTAGQPDAGVMEGGGYTLAGGSWPGAVPAAAMARIYLPVVMRDQ